MKIRNWQKSFTNIHGINFNKTKVQELSDIHFSEFSMVDDFGRVFFQNNKVFRAIRAEKKHDCLNKLSSDMFKELINLRLIPATKVADIKMEGYGLILEHEKLLNIKQHEWTFSMLKDASLMVLKVNSICNKYGFELKDAHTLNVLFRGTEPVYIDIGSIAERIDKTGWGAYHEFLSSFIVPLAFWSKNYIYIVRKLLESNFHRMFTIPGQSLDESGLLDILDNNRKTYIFKLRSFVIGKNLGQSSIFNSVTKVVNAGIHKISKRKTKLFSFENSFNKSRYLEYLFPFEEIDQSIRQITPPSTSSTWDGYHQKFYSGDNGINYSDRFYRIIDIIKSLDGIKSVIDLAGNEGYFSILLSKEIATIDSILLTDYDSNAIDSAYNYIKKSQIQKISPVMLNFMFTPDIPGTCKRLACDLAIALAVTHHLLLTANFSLPAIFERLKAYSKRYVMIEFMPLGLWAINDKEEPAIPEWYTVEWFRYHFSQHFVLIKEEKLERNRIIFVGEKR